MYMYIYVYITLGSSPNCHYGYVRENERAQRRARDTATTRARESRSVCVRVCVSAIVCVCIRVCYCVTICTLFISVCSSISICIGMSAKKPSISRKELTNFRRRTSAFVIDHFCTYICIFNKLVPQMKISI